MGMEIIGTYVRDAYVKYNDIETVEFRPLPEIADLNKKFATEKELKVIEAKEKERAQISFTTNTSLNLPTSSSTTPVANTGRR
jgi:hypothetical protein